ncbi:nucleotidyl transferase AbiEii/AbiGii toxin family protein [Agrobacterium rubi]|nr:nucleotidyl transferase AbiEii/AbiGii toxin family protein [Agrobacterium rubi]NTF24713.1 nucleotidyl transferase AbiEii/AbiGii toxin family protein [Agrobacterium rubi]
MTKNPSASLLARLKNVSKATGMDMPNVMRKYAHDRLLRLMHDSGTSELFCLKGGVLLGVLFDGNVYRPTHDLDFNGMKDGMTLADLEKIIVEICQSHDGSDGLLFRSETIRTTKDRDGIVPGGKLAFDALIGTSRIQLKIDIGYGNVITPSAQPIIVPTILPDLVPPIPFAAYPLETTIAEKMHAMCRHGMVNTRIKDYFDIYIMSKSFEFIGDELALAIQNTFEQHDTDIPETFSALSDRFAEDRRNGHTWREFIDLARAMVTEDFVEVVRDLRAFVEPVIEHAVHGSGLGNWHPETGWISYGLHNR